MSTPMISIPEALTRYANGEFLIVVDDLDRENEGDLMLLASQATPEELNSAIAQIQWPGVAKVWEYRQQVYEIV